MNKILIRKIHRYLGFIIGIQLLLWTASGLYFSWTNLDEIHGDHFKVSNPEPRHHINLYPLSALKLDKGVQKIELREVLGVPYYWINETFLFNAQTGKIKNGIEESEALGIAKVHVKSGLKVSSVDLITEAGKHHEYRGRPLPAYVISYENEKHLKAYVSQMDGKFQTVRHQGWRWFDFLWMTHTMDYRGRDNFNTYLLRFFALFGMLTVLSGFLLWGITIQRKRKDS